MGRKREGTVFGEMEMGRIPKGQGGKWTRGRTRALVPVVFDPRFSVVVVFFFVASSLFLFFLCQHHEKENPSTINLVKKKNKQHKKKLGTRPAPANTTQTRPGGLPSFFFTEFFPSSPKKKNRNSVKLFSRASTTFYRVYRA